MRPAVEPEVAKPHAPELCRPHGAAAVPGVRQLCRRHVLDARRERRRAHRDRNHVGVSVAAALLAAACVSLPAPSGSTQLVTVQAPLGSTTAALTLWERHRGCWQRVAGPWPARLGRSGLSSAKREGDGATPIGTFRFGATVFGIAPDPGLHLSYHRLVCGDWWDEDASSATYNRFRHVACGAHPLFAAAARPSGG